MENEYISEYCKKTREEWEEELFKIKQQKKRMGDI